MRHDLRADRDGGFNLLELMVVIVVAGILMGLAVPAYARARNSGYDFAVKWDLRSAASAEEAYYIQTNGYSSQSPVGSELKTVDYSYSSGTNYSGGTASITTHLDSTGQAYCLTAKSRSGKVFIWQSTGGGLLAANKTCSF